MNQLLFGVIGLLMLAILGVGFFDVTHQAGSTPVTQTSSQTSSQTAAVGNTMATSSVQNSSSTPTTQAPGTYTMAQIATHNSASSCWATIDGGVYDLTNWINQHPGGPEHILSLCGTDGSTAFNDQHGGESRPANELATFKIGTLAQ